MDGLWPETNIDFPTAPTAGQVSKKANGVAEKQEFLCALLLEKEKQGKRRRRREIPPGWKRRGRARDRQGRAGMDGGGTHRQQMPVEFSFCNGNWKWHSLVDRISRLFFWLWPKLCGPVAAKYFSKKNALFYNSISIF